MDVPRLLESVRKLMRTVLDPLSDQERYCAYAAVRSLLLDFEEHLRETEDSPPEFSENLKKLKYHLRVIGDFEERGDHLEIHHYRFALDILNGFLDHPPFRPRAPRKDPVPPFLPRIK